MENKKKRKRKRRINRRKPYRKATLKGPKDKMCLLT